MKLLSIDEELISTGEILSVEGSPFDFREEKSIGTHIHEDHVQLKYGKEYDYNFVLKRSSVLPVARVRGDKSSIIMRVYTSEPGMQFYSGNFMKGENKLRTGPDEFRTAFCLETQHFSDSPNQSDFPSTLLKPGQLYTSRTVYAFSVGL